MEHKVGYLEITSRCNFKCSFCPSESLKRKKCDLKISQGQKFIEQFSKLYPGSPMQLNVLGEPLLNKQLDAYFELCRQYHVYLILITNFSLMNDERAEQLFRKYNNFTLVLSLQTPTEESFRMRGCKNYTFAEYHERMKKIIELKFKYQCKCSIEIHVAASLRMDKYDSTILTDLEDGPFCTFHSETEMRKWHIKYLDELESIQKSLLRNYRTEYLYLQNDAMQRYEHEIRNERIVIKKNKVPLNMYEIPEAELWGYMCMPGVFLRYKWFGLWTKESDFIKSLYDEKQVFVYVAERLGKMQCPMAENIGILSNGDIISCCLDYEGGMSYGNIEHINLWDAQLKNAWEKDQQNVLSHDVCRRCKGDIIIASRAAISCGRQEVTFFASDWFAFEQKGRRRWSKAYSSSYVYARLNAEYLAIDIESPGGTEPVYFKIYALDFERNKFIEEYVYAQVFESGRNKVKIPFLFHKDQFYKIEIHTSTFRPGDRDKNSSDYRELGICLFQMELTGNRENG